MAIIVSNRDNYIRANSYLSLSEADAYIQDEAWQNLDVVIKENSLIENSLILDSLWHYVGDKKDMSQCLEFPRHPSVEIPIRVKRALAHIVKTKISDPDFLTRDIKAIQIGEARQVYNTNNSTHGSRGADLHLYFLLSPLIGFQRALGHW